MKRLDDALIIRFRDGDRAAFNEVYNELFEGLLTFCTHFVPREDAKDITIETFFKLWKLRTQWDNYLNVRAFLYITARNASLNYLSAQRTKSSKHKKIAEDLLEQDKLIEWSEIEADLLDKVRQAINSLPEYYQEYLRLAFFEGYTNPEIAEKLGVSVKTVRNAKSLALKMVKATFFDQDPQLYFLLICLIQDITP